jgi:outer membrane PBP1 activator LpoA protein
MKPFHPFGSFVPTDRSRRVLFFTVLLAGALLAAGGCQTVRAPTAPAPATEAVSAELEAAEKAERAGEYLLAARAYERAAEGAESPQRESLALKAVGALIQAGQIREARERLGRIDVLRLGAAYRARKLILEARLLGREGAHERAVRRLDEAAQLRPLDPALLAEIHQARAEEELALDNPIGAVRNYIERDRYIVGPEAIAANQAQLWKVLATLPRARLKTELDLARDPVLAGWLELALLAAEWAGQPQALARGIAGWRARYPGHPAAAALLEEISSQRPSLIGRVTRLAVLLPLSSDYALAAQAVRDGLIAMHAADPNPDKPQIAVYDTGADPYQVLEVYRRAVREGAEFVIGPLGREAAEVLARRGDLAVPTLLLSHLDEEPRSGLVFQFGLPPEQEARAAAERAWLDGRRRAALLHPSNPWGERMASAFRTHWQRLGGIVVAVEAYDEQESDHSGPIQRLLNITQSFARKERLERLLGTKIAFDAGTARRRQDVDMIFLAADAKSARLIKPQLDYYQASNVPVYATSHVFTGRPDPVHDVDLNDVYFSDMPWMLVGGGGRIEALRAQLQGNGWPYARSDLDRLYALGVDSYAVLPHLNRLRLDPNARFEGVSGFLSLDPQGRLQRQTPWARFRRGVPRLLDSFLGPETSPPPAAAAGVGKTATFPDARLHRAGPQ